MYTNIRNAPRLCILSCIGKLVSVNVKVRPISEGPALCVALLSDQTRRCSSVRLKQVSCVVAPDQVRDLGLFLILLLDL